MRYHNITKDDMLNGDGLRVVLWVAGCTHHCHNCQNPITWDVAGGIPFDEAAEKGQHYLYPHDFPNHWVQQQYLPDNLAGRKYYEYGDNKTEQMSKAYWEKIKK